MDDMMMALRYVVGKEFNSPFMSYIKAKALEIHSTTDEVIMLDGEVFPGPTPFRFVAIPSLLSVYGEYSIVSFKQTIIIVASYKLPVNDLYIIYNIIIFLKKTYC